METIEVHVEDDHLQTLSKTRKPILAVAELIWNGLDADATRVSVHFEENRLRGLESIRVADNGHGLAYGDAEAAFGNLGGSWKRGDGRTRLKRRLLHGRLGKGRFRAFSLGRIVEWTTYYQDDGRVQTYAIIGRHPELGTFHVGEPRHAKQHGSGTEVEVRGLLKNFTSLRGARAVQEITEHFALYLRQYPDVAIRYDGQEIDPSSVEKEVTDYDLPAQELTTGEQVAPKLTVIEWCVDTDRSLFLCDADGFALAETSPGIHARGFNFTAYLKDDYLRVLDEAGVLVFEELHPDLKKLRDAARSILREHFRERAAQCSSRLVADWKRDRIYPYQGDPRDPIEVAERQVFDVCALNVHEYLPDFETADPTSKRFTMGLLRHLIETRPTALRRILEEVLGLPKRKQEEFAELLERASLESIITASKVVADRLDFLNGLEILVFNPESKEQLLERKQLHRILAHHTWLFGEEYNLTIDDESLTEVLKKHLSMLGDETEVCEPVLREDGSRGIVDLVLSRRVPLPRADEREHLVIELKRPKKKIDLDVLSQIKSYAFAVADDERFKDTKTRWAFWTVSNDMADSAHKEANQRNRPPGMVYEDDEGRITIWAKPWAQVVEDCSGRLSFFQEELNCRADQQTALEYLRRTHEKYLPKALKE